MSEPKKLSDPVPVKLKFPVTVDGTTISAITLRRPKAKDMIVLGDHFPALAELDVSDTASAASAMNRKVFEAMVAIVSTLGSISDAVALELDYEDLVTASTSALDFLGEAPGGGAEKTG